MVLEMESRPVTAMPATLPTILMLSTRKMFLYSNIILNFYQYNLEVYNELFMEIAIYNILSRMLLFLDRMLKQL